MAWPPEVVYWELDVVARGLGESWGLSSAEAERSPAGCVDGDERAREVE